MKISIKVFVVLISLVIPVLSFAQTMDKPGIDKFTNDTTLFTTIEKVATSKPANHINTQELDAYFAKNKGQIYMRVIVKLPYNDYYTFDFANGTPITLKLADNSFITLSSIGDIQTDLGDMDGGLFNVGIQGWIGDLPAAVSTDDLQKLSSSTVTAIRVQTANINLDFDCTPTGGQLIKNMVDLIVTAK
jgi:hypothetical protein